MIKVELNKYSKNTFGQSVASFKFTYPRFIHGEMMTHRVFSRNAASSRAIPSLKMLKEIIKNTVVPKTVQKSHTGMQGTAYAGGFQLTFLTSIWIIASRLAVACAWIMTKAGASKQITNRLVEPFQLYVAFFTATEWENFTALRAHDDAEIHIQKLAYKVLKEFRINSPDALKEGEWHLPFVTAKDKAKVKKDLKSLPNKPISLWVERLIKMSTARSARVSYLNFKGTDDYQKDLKLHDRLVKSNPKHASPTEHPCRAMKRKEFFTNSRSYTVEKTNERMRSEERKGITKIVEIHEGLYQVIEYGWSGNFRGFIQYRKMITDESQLDWRIKQI